jgi:hypothetical protein
MERRVAYLISRPHVQDGLAGGGDRSPMKLVVVADRVAEMRLELVTRGKSLLRRVAVECGKRGRQRSIARRIDFPFNQVIVLHVEYAQKRSQRQALNHQRPQHHGKCRENNQIAEGKRTPVQLQRQSERRRQ